MDLAKMTLKELWKLNMQLDWEITKRLWFVYVIMIVIYTIYLYKKYK